MAVTHRGFDLMKSPWKWFSGLRARERSAQGTDGAVPGLPEAVTEIPPEQPELDQQLKISRDAADGEAQAEVPVSGSPVDAASIDEPQPSRDKAKPARGPSSVYRGSKVRTFDDRTQPSNRIMQDGSSERQSVLKKQARQSATKTGLRRSTQIATTGAKSADPMTLLDADITRLRIELSEKLRIQNHQLSELLKRYE